MMYKNNVSKEQHRLGFFYFETRYSLFYVEMVVIFIRLVYHDATLVWLELEVADAVLLDVLHHIGKHRLDEICACIPIIAVLGTQVECNVSKLPLRRVVFAFVLTT